MTTTSRADEVLQRYIVPIALAGAALLAFSLTAVFDNGAFGVLGLLALIGAVGLAARINLAPARAPVIVSTMLVSDAVRQQNLQSALSRDIAVSRGRVESVTPYSAVVVTGQRVNHVLHLLISVLLCGFWLPVWLLVALTGGEKRHVLSVDQCGNVTRS